MLQSWELATFLKAVKGSFQSDPEYRALLSALESVDWEGERAVPRAVKNGLKVGCAKLEIKDPDSAMRWLGFCVHDKVKRELLAAGLRDCRLDTERLVKAGARRGSFLCAKGEDGSTVMAFYAEAEYMPPELTAVVKLTENGFVLLAPNRRSAPSPLYLEAVGEAVERLGGTCVTFTDFVEYASIEEAGGVAKVRREELNGLACKNIKLTREAAGLIAALDENELVEGMEEELVYNRLRGLLQRL